MSKTYECVLIDFPIRREHGLDHELVAVLVVGVVLERLQAHWKKVEKNFSSVIIGGSR